jgi:mono/diheme cytochrome c family protein
MKAILRISAIFACVVALASASAEPPVAGVYKAKCAPCHGAIGDASTPAGKALKVPSFTSESVLKETDANMLAIAKNGKGKMPAWHDKLSDNQLKDLIAFIRALQKK